MGTASDKLTAVELRNPAPGRHWDGGGLYLEVSPAGGRWWRLKYRYAGKEKRLSLGVFPAVSLAEARKRRENARKLLAQNVDPSEERKATKAAREREARGTVAAVAADWLAFKGKKWSAASAQKARFVVTRYPLPDLGAVTVEALDSKTAAATIRKLAEHAPDLARKPGSIFAALCPSRFSKDCARMSECGCLTACCPRSRPGTSPRPRYPMNWRRSCAPCASTKAR
ncbi:MAG: hypothetical protein OMOMHJEC_03257 [Xanthomonadales bacterium]|nr:hypothetical protein [Xanthomonadales bacterium]